MANFQLIALALNTVPRAALLRAISSMNTSEKKHTGRGSPGTMASLHCSHVVDTDLREARGVGTLIVWGHRRREQFGWRGDQGGQMVGSNRRFLMALQRKQTGLRQVDE